uniref:Cell division cycle 20 homolog n=2 Tax=Haplochromis burtoni TaxID=8153 RepID=A0A3Q2WAY1_HAPBU
MSALWHLNVVASYARNSKSRERQEFVLLCISRFLDEVYENVDKMAQFGFENDIHSILKLDMPITNAPMARWQRKASSSNTSALSGLSPGKSANVSLSSSKTPSKTPGKNKKQTPSKMGGDRFIPIRNSKQMDVATFLLTKENEPADTNTSVTSESQKAWSVSLNGYNVEDAKILHLGGKPLNAPEGYQNNLKVLYTHTATPASIKKSRYISSTPDRILDAPDLRNDFYLNLLDWSSRNFLAVALHNSVYLWDATQGDIILLMKMEREEDYICSLSWTKEGSYLAVGTSDCKVQLWDVENQKRLRSMASHTARVGSLSWNDHVVSSGSRSGHIHHHDVRVADHHIGTLTAHAQEVCGLKWSPDGRYLASGGNDNLVCIWPRAQGGSAGNDSQLIRCWSEHQGAVKALAWCPWQPNILASGGGTSDRHIRIWNVNSGSCISSLDTQSQISSLVFAPNYKELVSAHGYAHNNVVVWKYPSLSKVAELNGHDDRVLSLTLSPDCSTVATVAADETIRLWKSFEMDPIKKKAKERMVKSTSSVIHQS